MRLDENKSMSSQRARSEMNRREAERPRGEEVLRADRATRPSTSELQAVEDGQHLPRCQTKLREGMEERTSITVTQLLLSLPFPSDAGGGDARPGRRASASSSSSGSWMCSSGLILRLGAPNPLVGGRLARIAECLALRRSSVLFS